LTAIELESGASRRPFDSIADPELFFGSASSLAAFARLRSAVVWGEPLAVLTSEAGMGKTELLHRLMKQLEGAGLRPILFGLPVSLEDLRARLPAPEPGHRIVVGLDEAQALDDTLLHALPALLAERPDLAIVLVGQRQLEAKLAALEAGGTALPASVRCRLAPLAADEVGRYIGERWRHAGSGACPFLPAAVERIADISGGIPQTINLLCSRALWLAETRAQSQIGPDVVDEASRDLIAAGTTRAAGRRKALALAVAIPLVIAGALMLRHAGSLDRRSASAPPEPSAPASALVSVRPPEPAPAEPAPAASAPAAGLGAVGAEASPSPPPEHAHVEPAPVPPERVAKDEALLREVENGDAAAARAALDDGASPNARDASGFTPLMLAVIHDDPAIAELLIASGAAINARNRAGLTPLMLAAINDNVAGVRALIAHKADMNARTPAGWTALTYAAFRGYPEVARVLLASGANPNAIDRDGWSIFQYASWRAAEPAPVADQVGGDQEAAPARAATPGYLEVMALLRQAGAKR
jgi:type II secretory pathway predicted ATPase ExeA